MSVSSSSSYASNPSTNLSTIAGASPGKLPQSSQQSQTNQNSHAQHKPAGPTGGTTTAATSTNNQPNTIGSSTINKAPGTGTGTGTGTGIGTGTGTATTAAGASSPVTSTTRISSPPVNPPIFHDGDSSTPLTVTKTATALPSTPLILTPELNDTLTNAYVPTHSDNSWMKDLVARMEAARVDIDTKAQQDQKTINDDATRRVNALLQEHKHQQDALIASSHARVKEIDQEFTKKKEEAILALETEKNQLKERLEEELVSSQQRIASEVRQQVSTIAEEAKQQKLKITEEAQQKERMLGTTAASSIAAHNSAVAAGNTTTTTTTANPTSTTPLNSANHH